MLLKQRKRLDDAYSRYKNVVVYPDDFFLFFYSFDIEDETSRFG